MKLNQILAIEKDVKGAVLRTLTDFYHRIEKGALLSGISRKYRSVSENGEQLPPESTLVQLRIEDSFPEIVEAFSKTLDLNLAKEEANQSAKADIVVDGVVLMPGVPVCSLLFLEKQVLDLTALVDKLPVLDPSEQWVRDPAQNCWATAPVETHRTKKLPKVVEKSPATDKHPAQVEVFHEDVVVGYWSTVKFSGALPATRKAELKAKVAKLRQAIKVAREEANTIKVGNRKMGEPLMAYVFGK